MDAKVINIITNEHDIREIAKFLIEMADSIKKHGSRFHRDHFRDWKSDRDKNNVDIIVINNAKYAAQQGDAPEPASPAR